MQQAWIYIPKFLFHPKNRVLQSDKLQSMWPTCSHTQQDGGGYTKSWFGEPRGSNWLFRDLGYFQQIIYSMTHYKLGYKTSKERWPILRFVEAAAQHSRNAL
jgi:hypothetical protein